MTGTSTQTEIIAVHTPQDDHNGRFPYQRPSTLRLPPTQSSASTSSQHSSHQLTSYADNLVDGVFKNTVAHNQDSAVATAAATTAVNNNNSDGVTVISTNDNFKTDENSKIEENV